MSFRDRRTQYCFVQELIAARTAGRSLTGPWVAGLVPSPDQPLICMFSEYPCYVEVSMFRQVWTAAKNTLLHNLFSDIT